MSRHCTRDPRIALLVALVFILCRGGFAESDNDSPRYQVKLTDGSELVGAIVSEDDSTVVFRTLAGVQMTIPRGSVERLRQVVVQDDNTVWSEDPNHTRLLFASTARPLKSGQRYVSVYELFFPFVAVGIGDYFTAAGGITLIPGADNQLFYLAPKLTVIQVEDFSASLGMIYARGMKGDDLGGGLGYINGTYGSLQRSVTGGVAWGFVGSEIAPQPLIMVGGDLQIASHTKLLTENWGLLGESGALLSLGIRFFGDNLAADFAVATPVGTGVDESTWLPWVTFTYNFGN